MTNPANPPGTLERGDIFFLFRPRMNKDAPSSLKDVQRFFIVLRPADGGKLRLLVVGRKRLPDVGEHERNWGFVDFIANSGEEFKRRLGGDSGQTDAGDKWTEAEMRPAGEGVYEITLQDGQMHLSYALELPERPSEVQQPFKIAPEASFILSIKNPEKGQPPKAGLPKSEKPDYPGELQREFAGRRFASEDIRLLDFPGAEFILIGARPNPERAYGLDLPAERELPDEADIFQELRLRKSRHAFKPLFEGRWR